jgi:CDGSH-type Zn-finger protein
MSEPHIAAKQPAPVQLEAGQTYYWCACGLSAGQPFCDGAHRATDLTPLAFTAQKCGTAFLCQCKHSKRAPYCDGAHRGL